MKITTGQVISHYRIIEQIGSGGMGIIYKAEDLKLKRLVALKFLPPDITRDADAKMRFIHEAQAASALEHNNICNIHEINETEDEQVFMVMAYYEGETLKNRIARLSIDEAIGIALQIAEGLSQAHQKGIIHRDIKPANIMITDRCEVKILDFGLAKLSSQTKLTKEGTTLGTVSYMSPEQARGEITDHRTDIWSLGVILYEMLSGRLPFRGEYDQAVIYAILNEQPDPIADLPEQLARNINKALAKDPKQRYQTLEEFITDLNQIPISTKEEKMKSGAIISRKKRNVWVIISIAVVLILASLIGNFIINSGKNADNLQPKKLVVLPFQNLGDPEDEYFADGITDEITSRLATISGLGVISRTSAFHYKNSSKTSKIIGEELGVQYILEGSVRWAKTQTGLDRVRISPQLIRVTDDTHLWTHTYEHVINDIFAIQSSIAQNVVNGLGVTLFETEREAVQKNLTDNLEAYQVFLQGRYFAKSPHFTLENWEKVIRCYQRAVELDSTFALAYAHLAAAHARLHYFQHDLSEKRLQLAKRAAQKSIKLAPELPHVHLVLSHYYIWAFRDPEKALKELELAEKTLSNNADLLLMKTTVYELVGRFDEAISAYNKAFELSPRDANIPTNLLFVLWVTRQYKQAVQAADQAIILAPNEPWPYFGKVLVLWAWKGASKETRDIIESVPVEHDWLPWIWYWQEIYEERYSAALKRLAADSKEWIRLKMWARPKKLFAAQTYLFMNLPENAKNAFDSARVMLEHEIKNWPQDPRLHSSLGICYAALGYKKEAIREGKIAVDILPFSKDAVYGFPYVQDLAYIYTLAGDHYKALEQIDYLLSIPCLFSINYLKIDPRWNPLRSHPRYKEILKKYQLE